MGSNVEPAARDDFCTDHFHEKVATRLASDDCFGVGGGSRPKHDFTSQKQLYTGPGPRAGAQGGKRGAAATAHSPQRSRVLVFERSGSTPRQCDSSQPAAL